MNVKELMIGDFVYKTYPKKHIVEWSYLEMFDSFGRPIVGRDIEPIPLTHEILVKNGLRECFDGAIEYEYFPEDKNGLLEITEENGEVWWTINIAEYRIAKLEYVHQLQHAIRLLGIDKEIEL